MRRGRSARNLGASRGPRNRRPPPHSGRPNPMPYPDFPVAPEAGDMPPEEFRRIEDMARSKGFLAVSATPMTRSSFHAGDDFARLQAARNALTSAKETQNG